MQQELKKRFFDMDKKLTELTRGEEEIMQILWRLGDVVVNEIIAARNTPRSQPSSKSSKTKVSSTTRPRAKATATIRP